MLSTNVKIKLNNKNQAKNIEKLNELMKNLTKLYSKVVWIVKVGN